MFLDDMVSGGQPPPFEQLHFISDVGHVSKVRFAGMGGSQRNQFVSFMIDPDDWPTKIPTKPDSET